jgi:hypothetical protein
MQSLQIISPLFESTIPSMSSNSMFAISVTFLCQHRARIFHESPAATTDMAVLPGVLGCRTLRRTVQVRLGSNPAVPRGELPGGPSASPERAGSRWRAGTPIFFALAALRSFPQAGSQFRGLATAIHEISGLEETGLSHLISKMCNY